MGVCQRFSSIFLHFCSISSTFARWLLDGCCVLLNFSRFSLHLSGDDGATPEVWQNPFFGYEIHHCESILDWIWLCFDAGRVAARLQGANDKRRRARSVFKTMVEPWFPVEESWFLCSGILISSWKMADFIIKQSRCSARSPRVLNCVLKWRILYLKWWVFLSFEMMNFGRCCCAPKSDR